MNPNSLSPASRQTADDDLPLLDPSLIRRIRQALRRVGDFGEISLVVVKGEIRFIRISSSESLADRPGS